MKSRYLILGVFALALALVLVASGGSAVQAAAPALNPVCPQAALLGPVLQSGELPIKMFMPYQLAPCTGVAIEVPFLDPWATSPHNDHDSEAFRHWDNTGVIPVDCAKCHSTPGYEDFLGSDGSTPNVVDTTHATGSTVECVACHNDVTLHKTSVTFPSGITLENLGDESRCMECHQGRSSGPQINAYIAGRPTMAGDPDAVDAGASFQNIHYYAAAATQYGAMVKGGYEYEGMAYDVKFEHVEGVNTCYTCHDMHTLQIKFDACVDCHPGVEDAEDVAAIRMQGSKRDYDGDGNVSEGIRDEIAGLQAMLLTAIQAYATEVSGVAIGYDEHAYPYFFKDTNGNGVIDPEEANFGNRYNAFTARLLKAAYNYQVSQKDGGKYAHGGKYMIELLHDSIADLNTKISSPLDLAKASREDNGHFDSSGIVWRNWDNTGIVPANCSRCHSADGLPLVVDESSTTTGLPPVTVTAGNTFPISIKQPSTSSMMCTTCHKTLGPDWERWSVVKAVFPSGAQLTFGASDVESNLCLTCHVGRNSTVSLNVIFGATADNAVLAGVNSVVSPHYATSGATLFGTEARGMYEIAGKTYKGAFTHINQNNSCIDCHGEHGLAVKYNNCNGCHGSVTSVDDLKNINMTGTDYDGNGVAEGLYEEIANLSDMVFPAMQVYAQNNPETANIVRSGNRFYIDVNGNGVRDPEDTAAYNTWTPAMYRAAYNFMWTQYRDLGAYAHNGKYVIQVLYDALESMGHNMTGLTRPS